LFLAAKTHRDVHAKLSGALEKIMATTSVQTQIQALAAEPAYLDGPAFGQFIANESKKWGAVIARLPKSSN
jgi:tripartite-type tricarboxylate transporter receptor subunit TctC